MRTLVLSLLASAVALAGCSSHHGHYRGHCTRCTARSPGRAHVVTAPEPKVAAKPKPAPEPKPVRQKPQPSPSPPPEPEPKAEPDAESPSEPAAVTEPADPKQTPAVKSNYGHAKDYSWLMGRLHRVHVPGGDWKIRFAPLHRAERWGGSMVLAPDARLDGFQDGDFVYMEGEILADRPSLYLSGPLYRVGTIRPLGEATRLTEQPAEGRSETE